MTSETIAVKRTLLQSKPFRSLGGTAKTVYLDFLMKCKVAKLKERSGRKKEWTITNNGEIEYCYSEAEKRGFTRPRFMRSIDELVEKGFIDVKHSGSGGVKGDKSKYAISDRWFEWGTHNFIESERPRDTRGGRGFAAYWAKKSANIGNENVNP